jgi:dTDP-4-dehydrorhamnose 3,5-epimerase
MPFSFRKLAIPGVLLVDPNCVSDPRGFFMETYKQSVFAAAGVDDIFVQENHSSSERGVLRGLHYQEEPYAQSKLIRVLRGEIFDVAVDIRAHSRTRGQWVATRLSAANRQMMYVPRWCAHGFCVLSEHAEVMYMTSAEYAPGHELGIMWNDPKLRVDWPISSPTLSQRDRAWPPFS